MSELPPEVRDLLAAPNIVHVATLMADGTPQSVAIWADVDGPRVFFFTQETSAKARNLRRDPRVAMSVVDRANPYATAWLRGRVVETVEGDAALALIDRLSVKYTGEPFPMRSGIVFVVEPERAASMILPFRETP
ncbi:MAG TPA: PPOX class F420-dependent oxidoreductase [Solirubrobacter sp.]|nr:PPOX class F420-dependent oxidoreductase [Solirubrobacter sp.]